jgi:cephalosporin-C deacetylase-like acetyl esterase
MIARPLTIVVLGSFLAVPLVPADDGLAGRDRWRENLRLAEGLDFESSVEWREPTPTDDLLGVESYSVRFPSPVVTHVEKNNTIDGILFEPANSNGKTIIFLPWFKERNTEKVEALCRMFAFSGFRVFFMPLGYQFGRAPDGWGSGDYIGRGPGGIGHLQEWIRQAVLDVQRTREWLVRERSVEPDSIGLMGVSLGGFVAAITYGVCPEFPAAAVLLAGGNLARYVGIGHSLGIEAVREALEHFEVDPEGLARAIEPYDPVTHADPSRRDGLLLINGLFDPMVPFPLGQDLWKAWGRPSRVILPSGHVSAVAFIPLIVLRVGDHFESHLD